MSLIRFDCPRCAKGLKAPENYAGRRVQCTSPACRHIFIMPQAQMIEPLPMPSDRRRNHASDFQDDDRPRGRPVLRVLLISLASVLLMAGAGWAVYWKLGQPTSAQVAAYEAFLKAGNELIDLQMSFDSSEELYAAEPQLREKARAMMAAKKENEGLTGRRKAALEERFKERQGQLQRRAFELLSSGKPGALLSPEALAREPANYSELGWPARKSVPAKSVPSATPKFDSAARMQQIAGVWDAKGFSFTLEPDGRGKALFIGKFSQGSGTFSVQDKNGAPVEMSAEFQVEFQGDEPRFAFTIEPSQGLECKYSFAVLPSPSPDLLIVKELGGGRLELNPTRMKRRVPGPSTSADSETDGEWKMDSAYVINTGKESQQLVVKSSLLMRVGGGMLEYSGLSGGIPKNTKFNVTFDAAASPKRFKLTDPGDPNNFQEGYYRVDGDVLLMRTLKRGGTTFSLDVTSDSVRLDKNPDGKDTDVPAGFLMQKGDPDNIIRYVRPKSVPEPAPPKTVDLETALQAMKGKWEGGNMTFTIEAGGGAVTAIYRIGNEYSVSGSRFDVTVKNNKPNISFRLGIGANLREYDFAVTLTDDPDELVLKEANGLVNPNPLAVRRAGSAKPVPKKPVDAKPYPPAPPKGTVGLSDLKITKAALDPPSVEFTVRLHDEGGEFLEAWASVGIPNPGELVKTCAGAIDQGLLAVNGVDFANPDPALKVQRATFKKGTMPGEWIGTVKYPKAVLDDTVVDFGLAAAVRLKDKIEKTNAAVIRIDLKTGTVIPGQSMSPNSRKEFRPKELARFESTWWTDAGFSADGSRVLGLGSDMQYSEWDPVRKERTYHKPGKKSFTSLTVSADFSQALAMERPDEKTLGRLHLWDVREGKSIRSWEEPKGAWELHRPTAAFSPDGSRVAVLYREPSIKKLPGGGFEFGSEVKSQVFMFESSTGKAVTPYSATSDTCLAFTSDGKQLLTDRYANIQVSDARTGIAERQFAGVPGFPTRASMTADGSFAAASCSRDSKYSVIVWEGSRNREVLRWNGFKSYVKFAFAPDNRTLLVMESGDRSKNVSGVIRAKDVPSDRALAYHELPKGLEFRQPAFSADGRRLAASAEDGAKGWVVVWDLEN